MRALKGMAIADIITSAMVLVIVVLILSFMFLINIRNTFADEPEGVFVDFIRNSNEPFAVFEGLSHLQHRQRQVFEHLLAAAATGSLQRGSAVGADKAIANFAGAYGNEIYIFGLLSPAGKIFEVSSVRGANLQELKCGESAFCTDDLPTTFVMFGGVCPVATVGVPDTGRKCKADQFCCKLDFDKYSDPNRDKNKPNSQRIFEVVQCGRNKAGICNAAVSIVGPEGQLTDLPHCGNGFVQIADTNEDCKGTNNGFTPTCCAPAEGSALEKARIAQRAEAPLLYKGGTLFEEKEFQCQDITEPCSGEYVSGLCPGHPNSVQCCVTDEIRCKAFNGDHSFNKYFCRDTTHCSGTGVDTIDNLCPDPNNLGRQSSYKCCTLENPHKEQNAGTGKSKGPCYLRGTPYTAEPVLGILEAATG